MDMYVSSCKGTRLAWLFVFTLLAVSPVVATAQDSGDAVTAEVADDAAAGKIQRVVQRECCIRHGTLAVSYPVKRGPKLPDSPVVLDSKFAIEHS